MSEAIQLPEREPPVLEVEHLSVEFDTYGGTVHAVRDVSFAVHRGETLAVVGESGCGKSVTMQSVMGLIPTPPGRITRGTALLGGRPLLGLDEATARALRGAEIGMIFQDPMTSLNPTMRVMDQIAEPLILHRGLSAADARRRAVELLDRMRVPAAAQRARQYPFEFSGGMLQRAMIAMAIACEPRVLIADEPTTALDVTIQEQILTLLDELRSEIGMAVVLITHDLGVVARMAQRVLVMYAGEIVERGTVDDIFFHAMHPYTLGLRQATPDTRPGAPRVLKPIEGTPPDLFRPPAGCGYFARCPHAMRGCEAGHPREFDRGGGHGARCWLHLEGAPATPGINRPVQPAAETDAAAPQAGSDTGAAVPDTGASP